MLYVDICKLKISNMIYVFKTSVSNALELESATMILKKELKTSKWNFDLEDCDNILRIDSEIDIRDFIIQNGVFNCIELT
jgi:hypothetical protein